MSLGGGVAHDDRLDDPQRIIDYTFVDRDIVFRTLQLAGNSVATTTKRHSFGTETSAWPWLATRLSMRSCARSGTIVDKRTEIVRGRHLIAHQPKHADVGSQVGSDSPARNFE